LIAVSKLSTFAVAIGFSDEVELPPSTRQSLTSVEPFQLAYAVSVPRLSVTANAGVVSGVPFHGYR